MADAKVKISALPAATSVNDPDQFVIVQGGTTKKVDYTYVKSLLTGSDVVSGTFDNTDLVANVWTLNHDRNTTDVLLYIFNPDGYSEPVIWRKVDANNVSVDFGGTITGTWLYMFAYWNPGTAAAATYLDTEIEIGAWDMNSNDSKAVAHGLDYTKIVSVSIMIYSDVFGAYAPLDGHYGQDQTTKTMSRYVVGDTNIVMIRADGCSYDNAAYQSTAVNRGIIYIRHKS